MAIGQPFVDFLLEHQSKVSRRNKLIILPIAALAIFWIIDSLPVSSLSTIMDNLPFEPKLDALLDLSGRAGRGDLASAATALQEAIVKLARACPEQQELAEGICADVEAEFDRFCDGPGDCEHALASSGGTQAIRQPVSHMTCMAQRVARGKAFRRSHHDGACRIEPRQ